MTPECIPTSALPHVSRLYRDYLAMGERSASGDANGVRAWYESAPMSGEWMGREVAIPDPARLADAIEAQGKEFGAGEAALANVERLRLGARAVVTGQQVGLLGGPLLTLLKAATAIARSKEAEKATGVAHIPIFWLATEDHDLEEVDQVSLPGKKQLETLRLGLRSGGTEVGGVLLGPGIEGVLDQASELMSYAPVCDLLRACYTPESTLGTAFARYMTRIFAAHGLIVMDAASRPFHALGAGVLRAAIERSGELAAALLARTSDLEDLGYSAQVLVKPGASLLFLVEAETRERLTLRPSAEGVWKAGNRSYTEADLLHILETEPERLSPNALLRPVFQDAILPTAAYIGGPAEIAYFAQSAVVYEQILGRLTPVLPRLTATLIEPAIDAVMSRHELSLGNLLEARTADVLTQRLGARAMPVEGKRKLAAVGNAMDAELSALCEYLTAMDESLGRSAGVSASKMRYQMNRLRRMGASFEVQKEASLRRHADALMLKLLPEGHLQERVIAGAWFLAQGGDELADRLVEEAGCMCLGHSVVRV